MIVTKSESGLVWYVGTFIVDGQPLAGVTPYPGHTGSDIEKVPRLVITTQNKGGLLAYAGTYELLVQALIISASADLAAHEARVAAILGIFSLDNLPAMLAALNAPASGPDEREVQGWALTGLELDHDLGAEEARDEAKGQFGTAIHFKAWANLT